MEGQKKKTHFRSQSTDRQQTRQTKEVLGKREESVMFLCQTCGNRNNYTGTKMFGPTAPKKGNIKHTPFFTQCAERICVLSAGLTTRPVLLHCCAAAKLAGEPAITSSCLFLIAESFNSPQLKCLFQGLMREDLVDSYLPSQRMERPGGLKPEETCPLLPSQT